MTVLVLIATLVVVDVLLLQCLSRGYLRLCVCVSSSLARLLPHLDAHESTIQQANLATTAMRGRAVLMLAMAAGYDHAGRTCSKHDMCSERWRRFCDARMPLSDLMQTHASVPGCLLLPIYLGQPSILSMLEHRPLHEDLRLGHAGLRQGTFRSPSSQCWSIGPCIRIYGWATQVSGRVPGHPGHPVCAGA